MGGFSSRLIRCCLSCGFSSRLIGGSLCCGIGGSLGCGIGSGLGCGIGSRLIGSSLCGSRSRRRIGSSQCGGSGSSLSRRRRLAGLAQRLGFGLIQQPHPFGARLLGAIFAQQLYRLILGKAGDGLQQGHRQRQRRKGGGTQQGIWHGHSNLNGSE